MVDKSERLLGVTEDAVSEEGKSTVTKTWVRWSVCSLAGICMVVIANHRLVKGSLSFAVGTDDVQGTFDVTEWGRSKCFKFTGGTCSVYKCHQQRHAECSYSRYCWCPDGCAGSDGNCYNNVSEYRLVAKQVRIRNVYFSDQYLYTPRYPLLQQLATASPASYDYYSYKWDIYELPGHMWITNQPGYFLAPHEFPEYTAAVASTKFRASIPGTGDDLDPKTHSAAPVSASIGSTYVVDTYHLDQTFPYNPELLVNAICKPQDGQPGQLEIRGGFGKVSWYSHRFSWSVYGWSGGDPGSGGYWTMEPPIAYEFPPCQRL